MNKLRHGKDRKLATLVQSIHMSEHDIQKHNVAMVQLNLILGIYFAVIKTLSG